MKTYTQLLTVAFLALTFSYDAHAQGIITTIAGDSTIGYNGDTILATHAELQAPYSVALDGLGNYYIADGYNNRIRKVNAAGIITTVAGTSAGAYNGDGIPAITAEIYRPAGITCDHFGNVYFADAFNNRIRKIDVTTGIITTIAGTGVAGYNGDGITADTAQLNTPHVVVFDAVGNLYITDEGNSRIRKINTTGIITTIAGTGVAGYTGDNGPAINAEINFPYGIVVDDTGNIYFDDYMEDVVRKIDTLGIITTVAGRSTPGPIGDNGPADSAKLLSPAGLAIDNSGNLYIADVDHNRIRKVVMTTSIITTVAGSNLGGYAGDNGLATFAKLFVPTGITIDGSNNLYITDFGNSRIRYVTSTDAVGVMQNEADAMYVYPNPCSNFFTLKITSGTNEKVSVIISNMLGEKVKEASVTSNISEMISLDVPKGIYFLSVVTSDGSLSKKICVKQ